MRYALLPQHLAADELVDGNALLEGGTFLSILFGTIAGGIAVALDWGTERGAACCWSSARSAALPRACCVPRAAGARRPDLRLSRNPVAVDVGILRQACERRDVKLSILGSVVVLAGRRGVPVADPGLRQGRRSAPAAAS